MIGGGGVRASLSHIRKGLRGKDSGRSAYAESLQRGDWPVSVMQPAKELGKATADVAAQLLRGEEATLETIVPPAVVTVDNIDEYIDYWK